LPPFCSEEKHLRHKRNGAPAPFPEVRREAASPGDPSDDSLALHSPRKLSRGSSLPVAFAPAALGMPKGESFCGCHPFLNSKCPINRRYHVPIDFRSYRNTPNSRNSICLSILICGFPDVPIRNTLRFTNLTGVSLRSTPTRTPAPFLPRVQYLSRWARSRN
jgi:hypothetical protein